MPAALVQAGRGDRQVLGLHDGRDRLGVERMADADPPRPVRDDVTAGVDAEPLDPGRLQAVRGALDGPALDQRGGIERAGRTGVEVAAGLRAQLLAAPDDPAQVRAGLLGGEVAATEPGHRAVVPVGAELGVDLVQPGDGGVDRGARRPLAAHVERHGGPHDVLDVHYVVCVMPRRVAGRPPPGGPVSVPITLKSALTRTWTSEPSDLITWTS